MNIPGAGGKDGNGSGPTAGTAARRKRVEFLKEKVGKGSYRVNSRKVAEKMVEDALRTVRAREGPE